MKYVLANANKAVLAGFDLDTHNVIGDKMVITEKGMMQATRLTGDEEERLGQLHGELFENSESLEHYLAVNK